MSNTTLMTRRALAGALVGGAAAAAAASRLFAQASLQPTPESTRGPFFPATLPADDDADMVQVRGRAGRAQGQVIEVSGRLLDRHGNPISGGRIDIWQANAAGRYDHPRDISTAPLDPDFQGFARLRTGPGGEWRITTIKPGGYDSPIGHRPPHIHFDVAGRGRSLVAQMYFPDEAAGNSADSLFRELGAAWPRSVAALGNPNVYRWDIILAGG